VVLSELDRLVGETAGSEPPSIQEPTSSHGDHRPRRGQRSGRGRRAGCRHRV